MPEKAFDEQCVLGTSTLVCVPDKSRKGTQSLPLFFRLLFLGLINEAVLIQNDGFIAFFLLPMPPRRQRRKTHQEILHKRDPPIRQASQLGYAKQRWCGAVDNSYPLFPYSKFLHSPINAFPSLIPVLRVGLPPSGDPSWVCVRQTKAHTICTSGV